MNDNMNEENSIIELFFSRDESAIKSLEQKYGRLARSLAMNILHNNEDTEECTSDAYLAMWNTIPPKRPKHLCAYFCSLVRNIATDRYDYNHASKRYREYDLIIDELEEVLSSPESENEETSAEISRVLDEFLRSERKTDRIMFVRRYYFSDSITTVAKRFGESEGAVSMRLMRMRIRLRKKLTDEGISL